MKKDFLVEIQRLPGRLSVRANAAIVPGLLVRVNLLQDEVIQFNNIRVLLKGISKQCRRTNSQTYTFSPNWFEVPSMQTTRFLPFVLRQHGLGSAPKLSSTGCLVRENQAQLRKIVPAARFYGLRRCSIPKPTLLAISRNSHQSLVERMLIKLINSS